MNYTQQELVRVIKRKMPIDISATRLGISVDEYRKLKKEYYDNLRGKIKTVNKEIEIVDKVTSSNYNEDKGTGVIEGILSTEPLSAQEIETKFKIDTTKWRLSSYWNKEKPSGGYFVSANITKIKLEDSPINILSIIDNITLEYTPAIIPIINTNYQEPICGIISLQDIHIGKQTIDSGDIEQDVKECVEYLIHKSYHSSNMDKIIFVLGGDLLNMDSYSGTTTSGTPVENSLSAYDAFKKAFDLMFWSVNYLKQFCNTLEVVYIPGNHSRLTESHIAYSLSKIFKDDYIIWNIEYAERKVIQYGINMFCFEHGDFDTSKSFFVFATEFASIWGTSKYRTLYTGHYHKKKTISYITEDETNGFQLKILPSLSRTDNYHYSNKWTGNKRGGLIELHSKLKGHVGGFNYYI